MVNEIRRARSSNLTPHIRNVSFFDTESLIRRTKSSNLIQQPQYKNANKFQFCQSDSRHIEKFEKAVFILTKSSNLIKKGVNEIRRARSSNLTPHIRNVSFFETESLIRRTKSSNLIQQPQYKNANKFQFCQSDSRHIEKFEKAVFILTKSSNLI